MISVSKKKVELFKELMKRFVDEVERGTHPLKAGWMRAEDPEANMLVRLELAEKGERGIRLLFDKDLRIGLGEVSDRDAEELIYICSDIARAVEVEKLITRVKSELQNSLQLQAGVVVLGWWRMLEASEFPVAVDEALQGGFSPDEWFIEASKASLELALSVAKKWWRIDLEKALESLREISFPIPEISKTERTDAIERVLRWGEALTILSKDGTKALAFLWFVDHFCISKGISCLEAENFVQQRAWELLERSLRKGRSEIMEQVENMIDRLPLPKLISWTEIIRFPW